MNFLNPEHIYGYPKRKCSHGFLCLVNNYRGHNVGTNYLILFHKDLFTILSGWNMMKQSQLWSQYHDKNELKHELREVGSFAIKFYIHMISITHPTFDNGNSWYPTACSGKGSSSFHPKTVKYSAFDMAKYIQLFLLNVGYPTVLC